MVFDVDTAWESERIGHPMSRFGRIN